MPAPLWRASGWFGTHRNIGDRFGEIAAGLHITIHLAESTGVWGGR